MMLGKIGQPLVGVTNRMTCRLGTTPEMDGRAHPRFRNFVSEGGGGIKKLPNPVSLRPLAD